jgi:hypothetical protein
MSRGLDTLERSDKETTSVYIEKAERGLERDALLAKLNEHVGPGPGYRVILSCCAQLDRTSVLDCAKPSGLLSFSILAACA